MGEHPVGFSAPQVTPWSLPARAQAEGWEAYKVGVKLRHGFVHRAEEPPKEGAEQFIDVGQRVVAHVAHVMANLTLTEVAKRSS